jgi:hypothetical protein
MDENECAARELHEGDRSKIAINDERTGVMVTMEMPPLRRGDFPDDETFEAAVASQKRREYAAMTDEIDISGLDKCEVLFALYEATSPMGLGFLQARGDVTVEDVRELIREWMKRNWWEPNHFPYIDYLWGRPLKVDLSGDAFDGRLFDRDAGAGEARAAVERLQEKKL